MTKITRPTGHLVAFASGAQGTERNIFGEYPTQSDDLTDNITSEYIRGWATTPINTPPSREDFNALGFTSTQLIAYLFNMGCAEWDVAQEYEKGSAAIISGNIYISKTDINIGNIPYNSISLVYDTTNWKRLAALEEVENANLINYNNSTSGLIATQVQAAIDEIISRSYIPAGAIQYFAMSTPPSGWLVADGSAISRTINYANLYNAIGTTYGVGDGSTTFNLPDLRGQFIRGFDAGAGKDPARVFGTSQNDAMQRHSHYTGNVLRSGEHQSNAAAGAVTDVFNPGYSLDKSVASYSGSTGGYDAITSDIISTGGIVNYPVLSPPSAVHTASTTAKASSLTETRPTNIAMNACIKY